MKRVVIFFAAFTLLFACDDKRVYETNIDFQKREWLLTDKPEFEFQVSDAAARYNLFLNIRNSVAYPYSRLFVNCELQDSSGSQLEKRLISAFLFDQKTGEPFGESGLGDIYDQRVPVLKDFAFKSSGKYKLKLEQYMRTDTLRGIIAVGIRLEKVTAE